MKRLNMEQHRLKSVIYVKHIVKATKRQLIPKSTLYSTLFLFKIPTVTGKIVQRLSERNRDRERERERETFFLSLSLSPSRCSVDHEHTGWGNSGFSLKPAVVLRSPQGLLLQQCVAVCIGTVWVPPLTSAVLHHGPRAFSEDVAEIRSVPGGQ